MSGDEALEGFYAALLDDDPEALYERAPCGYLSTSPDGTIIKVNQTFLTWTGYDRRDLVGRRTFAQLLTGGGRIYHETHYAPMLRMQGRVREIALDLVAADGRRIPALVNSVLERDAAGEPTIIRTALFDATERREYERELLRAKQRAEASEGRAKVLARTLQQALIPPAPPHIPHLDVAAVYRPAGDGDEIGGDFYDVFQVGPDDWVVVVGDVRGKGVQAAVVTALARHAVRAAVVVHPRPSRALEMTNEVLRHETDRFCTIGLVRLRRRAGAWTATISCGGHPLPLLARRHRPPVEVGRLGTLVGALPEAAFHDEDVELQAGDRLLLYTDGVTEARRGDEWFGEERLHAALAAAGPGSAESLSEEVLGRVMAFQSDNARDDIAIVALQVPPSPSA